MSQDYFLTSVSINQYVLYLQEQERSTATIQKYVHDLRALDLFLNKASVTKQNLIAWKEHLSKQYAPASVNSMLAALNSFLRFMGWNDLMVKPLKIQKTLFLDESRELTNAEYVRLVHAARRKDNERLSLVIQTLCATGIRVSELRFITAESVRIGRAEVHNKGKRRIVFLPQKLRNLLQAYLKKQKRSTGLVFVTRTGKPLNRSNIWRDMKALCHDAGVDAKKVFPHSLRRLFARTFYALEQDLNRLADILGHSNVNTTRIYTAESGVNHARQIERMSLVIT